MIDSAVDTRTARRVAVENNFIAGLYDGRSTRGEGEGGQSLSGSPPGSIYSINTLPITGGIAETPETPSRERPSVSLRERLARRLSQSFVN